MDRLDIVNLFVEKRHARSYLEIGVATGYTLDGCKASYKIGVDPNGRIYKTHRKDYHTKILCRTSDEAFQIFGPILGVKFDLIFIDGLHESAQALRDIYHALEIIGVNGTILLHDCNPPDIKYTITGDKEGNWTGDVYKAFIQFRQQNKQNNQYHIYCINTDWGVGVITKNDKVKDNESAMMEICSEELCWDDFIHNKAELLGLIEEDTFIKFMNS